MKELKSQLGIDARYFAKLNLDPVSESVNRATTDMFSTLNKKRVYRALKLKIYDLVYSGSDNKIPDVVIPWCR